MAAPVTPQRDARLPEHAVFDRAHELVDGDEDQAVVEAVRTAGNDDEILARRRAAAGVGAAVGIEVAIGAGADGERVQEVQRLGRGAAAVLGTEHRPRREDDRGDAIADDRAALIAHGDPRLRGQLADVRVDRASAAAAHEIARDRVPEAFTRAVDGFREQLDGARAAALLTANGQLAEQMRGHDGARAHAVGLAVVARRHVVVAIGKRQQTGGVGMARGPRDEGALGAREAAHGLRIPGRRRDGGHLQPLEQHGRGDEQQDGEHDQQGSARLMAGCEPARTRGDRAQMGLLRRLSTTFVSRPRVHARTGKGGRSARSA